MKNLCYCRESKAVKITYVKVGSSVLQDELSGVGLVLTVIDIHLELVSLGIQETA